MARICKETGVPVRFNIMLRDMIIQDLSRRDNRRIEVLADDLPLYHGTQLAIDTTMVSALSREGQPRLRSDTVDGAALAEARNRKNGTYPELSSPGGRARLVVVGTECGGRFSTEAWNFLRLLANSKVRAEPELNRTSAATAWRRRWAGMLAVASQRAFAESLLDKVVTRSADGPTPHAATVLEEDRYGDVV